jgi:glycosyltransferase involved in cell wall biosynthesis
MKTFSIITICYNSEKTIERTIKSVLAQTNKDYEYIIVDGASSDSTIDIVKKYEPYFEGRMKWQSEPDKGIYNAMNKGIKRATGTIIGIVNSDDWLESDALETINNCFIENNQAVDGVYCGWINFHYNEGTSQILKTNHNLLLSWSRKYEMAGIRHPATFVPKNVYDKYGVFDESIKIMADTDLILRFLFNGVKFYYPNKVVSNMSDGGVSNAQLMKACKDYEIILKKNNVSGFKFCKLYYMWSLKRFIKAYMPQIVMQKYRNKV